jgi:hypothetical protein
LFFGWDHIQRQCWGVRKSDGVPEHEIPKEMRESSPKGGDKDSPKVCARLKSCEPLYTCPRTPFYREAKGLLHSEITLESKEYSKCEHIQECLLHLVICGANFTYLQADHQFTPRTRTFEATPLTGSSLDLRPFTHENRQSPRSLNWVSAFTTEVNFFKISEVSISTIPRTCQVSVVLKQEADLRSSAHSAIVSHNLEGLVNHVKTLKHFHEQLHVTKHSNNPVTYFRTLSRIRQSLGYSEVSSVKRFYLIPQQLY